MHMHVVTTDLEREAFEAWTNFCEAGKTIVKQGNEAKAIAEWLRSFFPDEFVKLDASGVWLRDERVFEVVEDEGFIEKRLDLGAVQDTFFELYDEVKDKKTAPAIMYASSMSRRELSALKREAKESWRVFKDNAPSVVKTNPYLWTPPTYSDGRRIAEKKYLYEVADWLARVFPEGSVEVRDDKVVLFWDPVFSIRVTKRHMYRKICMACIKDHFIKQFFLERWVILDIQVKI